ncbi:MAG: hypothetical protein U1F43_22185 [Myxococcota bacterium]
MNLNGLTRDETASPTVWPSVGLHAGETWISDDDEIVQAGIGADGTGIIVSMRDLGADVSASFWDDEIAKLAYLKSTAAAPVLDARIVDDRFFVVTTEWAQGTPIIARLQRGPLMSDEVIALLLAALDVCAALQELGLSSSGMRLRSALLTHDDGRPRCTISTYGLHVDNDIEMFEELREIALRVLSIVGGHVERASLVIPSDAVSPELERVLRRAVGLGGPTYATPGDMAAAVLASLGRPRPRGGVPRSVVKTRPMVTAAVASTASSDLLLAEDFIRSLPRG